MPLLHVPSPRMLSLPTDAEGDYGNVNMSRAMITYHIKNIYILKIQKSHSPVFCLMSPCIIVVALSRQAHYYNVVRALLVF